jgi:aminotransferase
MIIGNSKSAIEVLREVSQKNSARVFLVDSESDVTSTFSDIEVVGRKIGGFLLSTGLNSGARVAVISDGSTDLVKIYFACLFFGIVVIPVDPSLADEDIKFILSDSRAHCLISSTGQSRRVEKLVPDLNVLFFGATGQQPQGGRHIKEDLFNPESKVESEKLPILNDIADTNELIVIYTSGTTDRPKGVVHTYGNIVRNGRFFGELHDINEKNRFLNCLPLTYLGGYYNLLLLPYVNEASVVLTRKFGAGSALKFWDVVMINTVNTLWFVPTMLSVLLEIDRGKRGVDYCRSQDIRAFIGTDVLASDLKTKFEERYAIKLYENYGLSETLFVSTVSRKNKNSDDGVGALLPGVEVKIVDNDVNEVPQGDHGEIIVRTEFLMKEYLHQKSPLLDGWFATGDLGCRLKEGNLLVSGRKKDLIIKGGVNISPARIESVVVRHDAVRECAVIGIPDSLSGEKIIAVVRMESVFDFRTGKEELRTKINSNLSPIQKLDDIIQLEKFPRTPSGKIQKSKLTVWLRDVMEEGGTRSFEMSTRAVERKIAETYFRPSTVASEIEEAISITYNNIVYEKKRNREDIITLSLGEAFFDIELRDFGVLPFPDIYHYSHSRGIPELRERLSEYFDKQYEVAFNPKDEIIITAGSKVAIYMTLLAVLNPGDEVIIFEPAWVSYTEQVKMCHGVPVQVPYGVEYQDYEDYVTNRTKAVILNNPQNPSGKIYSLEELTHICALAEKYNFFVISDEVYSEFVVDQASFTSIGNLDAEKTRLVICNSISKNYGISGWRIGYAITNPELTNQLLKLNQHLMTCPPTILQYYVSQYFRDIIQETAPQIAEVVSKRNKLVRYAERLGLEIMPGAATFYAFVSIKESRLSSDAFCRKLLDDFNVATVPGIGYGDSCDKYIRVSVGSESTARVEEGLETISMLVEATSDRKGRVL